MSTFFSPSNKHLMAATLLLFGLLMPTLQMAGAQSIGVCYGRQGNNLPSAQDVVNLYRSNGIGRMRVYDPLPEVLQPLRGSNIGIILDVPNERLQSLGDPAVAAAWVQTNIRDYSDVSFRYIAVGNEVDPSISGSAQYVPYVLPAMQNIHSAIVSAGLQDRIRVSTATYSAILENTFPPSQSTFASNARNFIDPIINFLVQNNLPLLANIYPYFSYIGGRQSQSISLPYALFTAPGVVVTDTDRNLQYQNLFDALLDSVYAALEKVGGSNVEVIVSESGWPSEGDPDATVSNAETYNRNLIAHVRGGSGTPRRPGRAIETYIFAMFDENIKPGLETERHFGLFSPNQQPKYQITFN